MHNSVNMQIMVISFIWSMKKKKKGDKSLVNTYGHLANPDLNNAGKLTMNTLAHFLCHFNFS